MGEGGAYRHRRTGAADFLHNHVALGAVLQRQLHAKLLGDADGGADIIRPVGMGLQRNLAPQHGDQGLQLHIKGGALEDIVPGSLLALHVLPGPEQHLPQLGGGGHAGGIALILVAALGVFTESTLHGHRCAHHHVVYTAAPGLDGHKCAAQHVGATRAGAHSGHASFQSHTNSLLHGIEAVDGTHLAGQHVVHFVVVMALKPHAVVVQAQVAVGLHQARIDPLAGHIQNLLTRQGGNLSAHGGNAAIPDGHVALVGLGMNAVIDHSVFQYHGKLLHLLKIDGIIITRGD